LTVRGLNIHRLYPQTIERLGGDELISRSRLNPFQSRAIQSGHQFRSALSFPPFFIFGGIRVILTRSPPISAE
jgi:hypothetical protein